MPNHSRRKMVVLMPIKCPLTSDVEFFKSALHDVSSRSTSHGGTRIGDVLHKVTDKLQVSDFYSERNVAVFQACIDLYGRNTAINQVTVSEALSQQGKQDVTGGAAYLSHLISGCPTALDIEDYSTIVARLGLMRSLIKAAEKINEIGGVAARKGFEGVPVHVYLV